MPIFSGSNLKKSNSTTMTAEDGCNSGDSDVCDNSHKNSPERDEVKEIQRLAYTDTRLIRTWRLVMFTAILATAVSGCATLCSSA